jgi:hypothetical protein
MRTGRVVARAVSRTSVPLVPLISIRATKASATTSLIGTATTTTTTTIRRTLAAAATSAKQQPTANQPRILLTGR